MNAQCRSFPAQRIPRGHTPIIGNIPCKFCKQPMPLFDTPRSRWDRNPNWKTTCADCGSEDPNLPLPEGRPAAEESKDKGIELDCGHYLCARCIYLRCAATSSEDFHCPICFRIARALKTCKCNVFDIINHTDPKKPPKGAPFSMYCTEPGCWRMLPPLKQPYFVAKILEHSTVCCDSPSRYDRQGREGDDMRLLQKERRVHVRVHVRGLAHLSRLRPKVPPSL